MLNIIKCENIAVYAANLLFPRAFQEGSQILDGFNVRVAAQNQFDGPGIIGIGIKGKLFVPSTYNKDNERLYLQKCLSLLKSKPHKQLLVMRLMGFDHIKIAKESGVPERVVRKMEDEALDMIKNAIEKDAGKGLPIPEIIAKKNYQKKVQIIKP